MVDAIETKTPEEPQVMAERILSAVERITDTPQGILELVGKLRKESADTAVLVERIVSHYSNRSAIAGGATALPALLPGIGTAAYLATGPLADMVLLLKFEVEMSCALAAAHGFDITRPEERQLAFLLAAVKTSDESLGRSVLADVGEVGWTAIWNYAPRRVVKLLVEILALIAVAVLAERLLLKAIPLVGIAVGAGMNKVLTSRVGKRANEELELRAKLLAEASGAKRA